MEETSLRKYLRLKSYGFLIWSALILFMAMFFPCSLGRSSLIFWVVMGMSVTAYMMLEIIRGICEKNIFPVICALACLFFYIIGGIPEKSMMAASDLFPETMEETTDCWTYTKVSRSSRGSNTTYYLMYGLVGGGDTIEITPTIYRAIESWDREARVYVFPNSGIVEKVRRN